MKTYIITLVVIIAICLVIDLWHHRNSDRVVIQQPWQRAMNLVVNIALLAWGLYVLGQAGDECYVSSIRSDELKPALTDFERKLLGK